MAELSPGSTGRRWEPEGGVRNHNERIHRESKIATDHKNLPFEFSKPKNSGKTKVVRCKKCKHVTSVPKNTVGMICDACKKYVGV